MLKRLLSFFYRLRPSDAIVLDLLIRVADGHIDLAAGPAILNDSRDCKCTPFVFVNMELADFEKASPGVTERTIERLSSKGLIRYCYAAANNSYTITYAGREALRRKQRRLILDGWDAFERIALPVGIAVAVYWVMEWVR